MDIKNELKKYIDENLKFQSERKPFFSKLKSCLYVDNFKECANSDINIYIEKEKDENKFQKLLFKYIDSLNLKDSDVYNSVNIDRRLFSKIRSNLDYHPSKETVILLAIALKLSDKDLEKLLNSASYSLPKNNVFDLIIRFCFERGIYDINKINELLYDYDCKTLN